VLAGTVRADVCVVGGGIAGCSTALHLAERGYRVVLLEQHRIGWGASGRSGAQALFGVAAPQEKLERLIGAADARRIWDMPLEGIDLIRERIARHGIDCDWRSGQMHVSIKPRHVEESQGLAGGTAGPLRHTSARLLIAPRSRACLRPTSSRRHGTSAAATCIRCATPWGWRPQPRQRAPGSTRTRRQGYERRADADSAAWRACAPRAAKCCADAVAFAGNAWLGGTVPKLARRIMPVGTYIVATEPLGAERAAALIRNNAAVTDMNWVLDYYRRSADHRLLFGGRVSYSGLDPLGSERATRARMLRVFPQLEDVKITHSWGGYVDITLNRAPDFGRLEPEVWYLQGFSGHGIVLAGLAGKVLAEAIAGQSERLDVFARIPHLSFRGGMPLRRAALVLAGRGNVSGLAVMGVLISATPLCP
jgi:gamma-glutamylputrescine oxidase